MCRNCPLLLRMFFFFLGTSVDVGIKPETAGFFLSCLVSRCCRLEGFFSKS